VVWASECVFVSVCECVCECVWCGRVSVCVSVCGVGE